MNHLRFAGAVLALFVAACGRPDLDTSQAPSESPAPTLPVGTDNPTTSPSPTATSSTRQWETYSDPGGRFTLDYPSGWRVVVSPEGESGGGSVHVHNYSDQQGDLGWAAGMVKIELNFGPSDDGWWPLEETRPTSISGRPATYAIYRSGHKFADGRTVDTRLKLIAMARVTKESTTYDLSVRSANDPPSADEQLFGELLQRFKLK